MHLKVKNNFFKIPFENFDTMKLLLFKILFLFTIPSFAQRGIIIGKASEKNLNKGIEFANVTLYIAKDSSIVKGVLTDSIGNFELNNLNKGTYILKISSIGFNFFYTNYLTIDLDNSIISLGSLSMEVDQKVLQEVIVNGERPAFERQTDRIVLNVSTNSLYKTSVNALDILKKAPNLQVKANGSIVMRGIITPKYLINGKPIQMDEEELKNYLNTLTPDMIESIDIITNPSSKYDSEFKGIIDIKLKNDKTLGWKGNYNCTVLKNEYFSWNNGINLTYKTKKLIFSNQLSYNNGTDIYEFYSNQKLPNKSVLITDTKRPLYNQTTSYQFGIDYSLKEKQSFSILLKGFNSFRSKTSETFITNTNDNQNVIYNKTFSKNYSNPRYNNYSANINYEANFDSKQLSIFASIANIHNSEEERIININSFNNSLSSEWRTDLNKNIFIRSIQIDF